MTHYAVFTPGPVSGGHHITMNGHLLPSTSHACSGKKVTAAESGVIHRVMSVKVYCKQVP